ncbi:hypothetical protein ABPG74_020115 [Tetrahymena malaccensis]
MHAKTIKFLEEINFLRLDLPAPSPNLNPIEKIWPLIMDKIRRIQDAIQSKDDQIEAIEDLWSNDNEEQQQTIQNIDKTPIHDIYEQIDLTDSDQVTQIINENFQIVKQQEIENDKYDCKEILLDQSNYQQ